jgi:hypothetical protein
VKNHRVWDAVLERLDAEEMPPEKAPRIPTSDERRAVVEWIGALREEDARKNAGDPGTVLGRRLSSAEFDYTMRPTPSIPLIDTTRERRDMWYLKRRVLPGLYWKLILTGRL